MKSKSGLSSLLDKCSLVLFAGARSFRFLLYRTSEDLQRMNSKLLGNSQECIPNSGEHIFTFMCVLLE
jgi:hypothetical protein